MPTRTHPATDDDARTGVPTPRARRPDPAPAAASRSGATSTPLSASGLHLTYPGATRPALDGVDLVVHPGECLALLGPNGAGKTSLIRLATGLRTPDRGTIRLAGGDPRRADVRRRMAVMMQATSLPGHLTVAELVVGAAQRAGHTPAAARQVMDEVGVGDLASRRAHHLSGGQARRLQLARALVVEPDLLILDEPTEGLDTPARRRTWDHIDDRRDRGMAILLTTHIVAEAAAVTDRVAVITDGRIVADDTPRQLTDRLPDRTIQLRTTLPLDRLRDLPDVIGARRDMPDVPGASGDQDDHGRPDDARPPVTTLVTRRPEAVLRLVLAQDDDASGLRVEGASLEDAVEAITVDAATASSPTTATTERSIA